MTSTPLLPTGGSTTLLSFDEEVTSQQVLGRELELSKKPQ
jgi:hypothetical protein